MTKLSTDIHNLTQPIVSVEVIDLLHGDKSRSILNSIDGAELFSSFSAFSSVDSESSSLSMTFGETFSSGLEIIVSVRVV